MTRSPWVAKLTITAAAITAAAVLAQGADMKADIHVSPKGDDSNPGTSRKPFRTIAHAAAVIEPGQTCLVHGGRYRESVTLTKSGTEKKPIRFVAAPGDSVVLDGTEPVTGPWERHEGKIYKTKVNADFIQLFADGKMMLEARWPNIRFRNILGRKGWAPTGKGSRYGKIVDPRLAKTNTDWTGAHATLNVAHQFFTWSRRIVSHDRKTNTIRYPKDLPVITHYANKTGPWEDNRYHLSGKLAALDQAGEWFMDTESKTLYLWALDGDSPEKRDVAVKTRIYGFHAKGQSHVEIKGFEFFGCTARLEECTHCVVDACHFLFPVYVRDLDELAAKRKSTPSTFMSGEHNTFRNSSLAFSPTHGLVIQGSHNLVDNNLIHSVCWCGSLTYAAIHCGPRPGKEGKEGGRNVIRRNTAFDCGNAIVAVGHMPNFVVEYNHLYDGGKTCKDVSLLYTQLPVIEPSVFRYNWIHGCHSPHIALGIRGDDQTRGLEVHHNVVWDCGWAGIVVKGDRNKIYNNTVLGSGKSDIILRDRPEPKKPWRKQWPLLKVQNKNTEAYNNCARKSTSGSWEGPSLTCKQGNNYSAGKPMLTDPGKMDFRPREGSPLIDAGREIPGYTDSFEGKAPDIGAYEYGGEHWVPGVTWDKADVEKRLHKDLLW